MVPLERPGGSPVQENPRLTVATNRLSASTGDKLSDRIRGTRALPTDQKRAQH